MADPKIFSTFKRLTILLTGLTGSGKTTQIGQFASRLRQETGQLTRLYTGDYGGLESIQGIVKAGTILVTAHSDTPDLDPFLWAERAVRGQVLVDNKWVTESNKQVGARAFDSATQFGQRMGEAIKQSHADDTKVGIGAKAFVSDIAEGLKVAQLDKSHYGMVQARLESLMKVSQSLPGHLIWTAGMRRLDQDDDTKLPVVGPDLFGKALCTVAPGWFKYTWPLVQIAQMGSAPKHVMYLMSQQDPNFGMALSIANSRIPKGGLGRIVDGVPENGIPPTLDPADICKALELLAKRQMAAETEELAKVAR